MRAIVRFIRRGAARRHGLTLGAVGLLALGGGLLASWRGTAVTAAQPRAAALAERPPVIVRGYLAVAVGGSVDSPAGAVSQLARDIYLPGINVHLEDLIRGTKGSPVHTDLSGRYTVYARGEGRYRICWDDPTIGQGCSAPFAVSPAPTFVDLIRVPIAPVAGTTKVFGKVRMKDGSSPRRLEPLANINAFAKVALLDAQGNQVRQVFVNNFGEYFLPHVPVKAALTLRATIEGAVRNQKVLPEANLAGAPLHQIDLTIGNTPPRIEPITPITAAGRRVKVASPGDTVVVRARASDADGDAVKFKWVVSDGSGTIAATDTSTCSWTIPKVPGLYSLSVLAYDDKGGYSQSSYSLRADDLGIPFSGTVVATNGPPVAGAEVEINGQTAFTGAEGFFQVRVKDATRFVLNIRKAGFGLNSKVYDGPVTGGRWSLVRASVHSVDPKVVNAIAEVRDERNCVGPASARLNWAAYPQLAVPQWQDGKGNVIAPAGKLDVPLPLDWQRLFREKGQSCGPGIRLTIPPNSLVDEHGAAPTGNVDVALTSIDLLSSEQMPGDYSIAAGPGGAQTMESFGAGTIDITAGGRRYNLKSGAEATLVIPVGPSQFAGGAAPPPTIPLLSYDERKGIWVQEGLAQLMGKEYVGKVKHFSTFNMDTLKVNQSCVRVLSPSLPASFKLEVTIPMGPGQAPKVFTKLVDNAASSENALFNLPNNVNIVLVPIRIGVAPAPDVPIGVFVVNTGGHQNPTTPNSPVGPPYLACSTQVTLTDQVVPDEPVSGEFLQGIGLSFEASNLNELIASGPTGTALANDLDAATANYYKNIDPRGKRLTLAGFQATNNFGGANELHSVYANSGDLGFGRDMHCVRNGADVAAYVTNYGTILTPDDQDVADAVAGTNPVATVAMEYSRIESAPGQPVEFDDPEQVVKFYVYVADGLGGTKLARSADLDSGQNIRKRPIPQLCMGCHGGEYPGGFVPGVAPPFNSRDDVKLKSRFLPFDLHFYTFAPSPHDKGAQQLVFQQMNQTIVQGIPADSTAIGEIITQMYAGGTPQNESINVAGWVQPSEKAMYTNVVSKACRTCHAANVFAPLRFDQAAQVVARLGPVENRVCSQHIMPHAKVTHGIFWGSSNPSMPAQLQAFGTVFGTGLNGWSGTKCGAFTPGGPTPTSLYSTTIQPIWDGVPPSTNSNACTNCHVGASPPQGLNLTAGTSYGNLFNVTSTEAPPTKRVAPGDAAHSYLNLKVNNTQTTVPGGKGSQMPLGGPPLSSVDRAAILTWINAGAPPP